MNPQVKCVICGIAMIWGGITVALSELKPGLYENIPAYIHPNYYAFQANLSPTAAAVGTTTAFLFSFVPVNMS